jgi:hypothetical protein
MVIVPQIHSPARCIHVEPFPTPFPPNKQMVLCGNEFQWIPKPAPNRHVQHGERSASPHAPVLTNQSVDKHIAGIRKERLIRLENSHSRYAFRIVLNSQVLLPHNGHHKHTEVPFGILKLLGVLSKFVMVPLRF